MQRPDTAPFYKLPNDASLYKLVVENQTKEMTTEDLKKLGQKVYEEEDCVYCLCEKPNIVFEVCAHMCLCQGCYAGLTDRLCPMCRQRVTTVITIKASELGPQAGGDESEEEKKVEEPALKKQDSKKKEEDAKDGGKKGAKKAADKSAEKEAKAEIKEPEVIAAPAKKGRGKAKAK